MKEYLERFRAWWAGLAERERRILTAGGAVLAVLVGYLAIWEPLHNLRDRSERALADARVVATRLEHIATEMAGARGSAPRPSAPGQSLLAAVDQSSRTSGIGKAPSRLQPEGDRLVRVWLDDVPFDAVIRWLHDLQVRHGVRVETADIERESAPGLVNVRLTLVRG